MFELEAAPLLIPEGAWKEVPGSVVAPKGFRSTGMYSGMRAGKRADLALIACDVGAVAAGTFTQNVMCAAPVTVCKDVIAKNRGAVKAVLVNAGQANAATGDLGMKDAKASQAALAGVLGCSTDDVLIMSTGVIGRRLALDKMTAALPELVENLGSSEEDGKRAAVAITTTGAPSPPAIPACMSAMLPRSKELAARPWWVQTWCSKAAHLRCN